MNKVKYIPITYFIVAIATFNNSDRFTLVISN